MLLQLAKKIIKCPVRLGFFLRDIYQHYKNKGQFYCGHYYSPTPDKTEVDEYINRSLKRNDLPDIQLNGKSQKRLSQRFSQYYSELPFPEKKTDSYRYFYQNSYFTYSDAIFLYSFLRENSPKRIIEVGSGFSSAVILDTIEKFYEDEPELIFVEPDLTRLKGLASRKDLKKVTVIEEKLQNVSVNLFSKLDRGDLLFIDSSHVFKCGSDLHWLFFEILPYLHSGVFVHFHDIFFPFTYPKDWIKNGTFWNESYFLRAFLAYNSAWQIYFFNNFVTNTFKDYIASNFPLCNKNLGASLYLQKS